MLKTFTEFIIEGLLFNKLAIEISKKLAKGGLEVRRNDAISTHSVYLFVYNDSRLVAQIRISDHRSAYQPKNKKGIDVLRFFIRNQKSQEINEIIKKIIKFKPVSPQTLLTNNPEVSKEFLHAFKSDIQFDKDYGRKDRRATQLSKL